VIATLLVLTLIGSGDVDDTDIVTTAEECSATEFVRDHGHSIVFTEIDEGSGDTDGQAKALCVSDSLLPDWAVALLGDVPGAADVTQIDVGEYRVIFALVDGDAFFAIYESGYEHDREPGVLPARQPSQL
jgi:hypothetical protein